MLGRYYYVLLFHSAVIAKFPQKLYGGIQDGTSEISYVSILEKAKLTHRNVWQSSFKKALLYTFKKCRKIVLVQIAAKKLFGNFVS